MAVDSTWQHSFEQPFPLRPIPVDASLMQFLPPDAWKSEKWIGSATVTAKFIPRAISIQVVIPELRDEHVMLK